jgi:hypothetical protein
VTLAVSPPPAEVNLQTLFGTAKRLLDELSSTAVRAHARDSVVWRALRVRRSDPTRGAVPCGRREQSSFRSLPRLRASVRVRPKRAACRCNAVTRSRRHGRSEAHPSRREPTGRGRQVCVATVRERACAAAARDRNA